MSDTQPLPSDFRDDGAPVITLRHFAYMTGLSRYTIYRLIAAGDAPPRIRLSARRIGFKRVDVERWLDARRLTDGVRKAA